MSLILPGIIAILLYIIATVMQLRTVISNSDHEHWPKLLGGIAVLLHAWTALADLLDGSGIDLGVFPMLSLMALSIAAIVLISGLRRPVDNLFIVIFPLATLTLALELGLQGESEVRNDVPAGTIGHIVLSIVAYSLLTIAAVQALLLSLGDTLLRNRRLVILQQMPSLETMEELMFEMVAWGLVFLTLSITSGFLSLEDISGPGLWHHTIITLLAWAVFIVLLWGRQQLGWRGEIASRWALTGFVLLALGYFGSKVVLEMVLLR